jgi:tetratricopeptide (TPR) repeat protein
MMSAAPWLRAALLVAMTCAAPAVSADRESAQHFTQRGDKALQTKTWAEAEQLYRRALEEDATFLPARFGLAEALFGAGQRGPGIDEMRKFCDESAKVNPLPVAWKTLQTRAKKKLGEMDTLGAEWAKTVQEHVTALLAFAGRWKTKDPTIAVKALEAAAALRPDDSEVKERLTELQGATGPKAQPLWNGKDFAGWTGISAGGVWNIEDGAVVAQAKGNAYLGRSETLLKGNFDLRAEIKLHESLGRVPLYAIVGTMKEDRVKVVFGVLDTEIVVDEWNGEKKPTELFHKPMSQFTPAVDAKAWNTFELRYRADRLFAFLNGQEVYSWPRSETRDSGYPAMQLQDARVGFRRIEYVPR